MPVTVIQGEQYSAPWTSDGSGVASVAIRPDQAGWARSVKIVPNLGATQPNNNFSVSVVDEDGLDLCNQQAISTLNTGPTLLEINPPVFVSGAPLTVQISGAGSGKTGIVRIVVVGGI